jgi:hypothetical protein
MTEKMSRRNFLATLGLGTAAVATGALTGCEPSPQAKDAEWFYIGRLNDPKKDGNAIEGVAQLNLKAGEASIVTNPAEFSGAFATTVIGKVSGEHQLHESCENVFIPQGALNGATEMQLSINGRYNFTPDLLEAYTQPSSLELVILGQDHNKEERNFAVKFGNPLSPPNVYFYNSKFEIVGGIRGSALKGAAESYAPPEYENGIFNYEPAEREYDTHGREYQPINYGTQPINDLFLDKYRQARKDELIGNTHINSRILFDVADSERGDTKEGRKSVVDLFVGLSNSATRKTALDRGVVYNTEKGKELANGQGR